jgi:hypothetical protein
MTAPVAAGSPEAAQAAQEALAATVAAAVARAWPQLDVANLDGSLPGFASLVAAITHRYGQGSAAIAALQYQAARRAAGIGSGFTVTPAAPATLEQVGAMVSWATQPLWDSAPALEQARRQLVAGAEKLVLDAGRRTIIDNVKRDPKAHGWARVTEAEPCYFCALLATRGAVYKHDTADFRSHDHCRCHAEPAFGPYEPPARVREWQQLYSETTGGMSGSKNMQRAWRQAFQTAYPQ